MALAMVAIWAQVAWASTGTQLCLRKHLADWIGLLRTVALLPSGEQGGAMTLGGRCSHIVSRAIAADRRAII
jgi:hypothetical protein